MTAVQFKTEYASLFATWGLTYLIGYQGANPNEYDPANYYDSLAVGWAMYDWYNALGDIVNRDKCVTLASRGLTAWRSYINSTTPHGGIPGYRQFPHGLYLHANRSPDATERTNAKQALSDITVNGSYSNYNSADLKDMFGSRENTYRLETYIYNYLVGNDVSFNSTAANVLIANITGASGHFAQWQRLASPPQSAHIYMRAFMVYLSSRGLIRHHDLIAPISGLFTSILPTMWEYIYSTAAYYNVGTPGSLYPVNGVFGNPSLGYTDVNTNAAPFSPGDNGYGTENVDGFGVIVPDSVDLSWLISGVLARLYKETGLAIWRTRFDNLWNNALPLYHNGPSDYSQYGGIYLGNQNPDTAHFPGDTSTTAGIRGVRGKHVDQSWVDTTQAIADAEAPQAGQGATSSGIPNAISLLGAGQSGKGAVSYSITGTITSAGSPLSGVTVSLTGTTSASTTTDAFGMYTFAGLANGASYTVTPTLGSYVFTPTSKSGTISAAVTGDFTAALDYSTPQDDLPASSLKSYLKMWVNSNMLNASAATAANNDKVDKLLDATGNGYFAQQTTDGSRGTCKTNILNGFPILELGGSAFYNFGNTFEALTNNLAKCTFGGISTLNTSASNCFVFRCFDASFSVNRILVSFNQGKVYIEISRTTSAGTNVIASAAIGTYNNTTWHAFLFSLDFLNNDFRVYLDNAEVTLTGHTIGSAGNIAATNGNQPRFGASFDGRWAELWFANDLTSSGQRSSWFSKVKPKFALTTW